MLISLYLYVESEVEEHDEEHSSSRENVDLVATSAVGMDMEQQTMV